jgi:metal-responsive CopG/Arc/MetJ family transcriptional regulator
MTAPSVKTSISLERALLRQIDSLAHELDITRSRLIAMAAEDFIRRHESKRMVAALDRAYFHGPTLEETRVSAAMRERHRRRLARER